MVAPVRLPPLSTAELDVIQSDLLGTLGDLGDLNIFRTFIRHPRLFRRWSQLGGVLLTGLLPERDRELLVLRTAHRCGSDYEWHQHSRVALAAGLSQSEIDAVASKSVEIRWSEFDAALLRAADELHDAARLSDSTWAILADRYDERQMIEVCMVVGHFHLVAFSLNSLGVQLEGEPTATWVKPDSRH